MPAEIILDIGIEGGGETVYGRRAATGWTFVSHGSSIGLDENDDELWTDWERGPETDLARLLPPEWHLFSPRRVHPEFVGWFREAYAKATTATPRRVRPYVDARWRELLGLAPIE